MLSPSSHHRIEKFFNSCFLSTPTKDLKWIFANCFYYVDNAVWKELEKNYCEYFLFFFALKFMTESKNGLSTIRRFEPKGNYVFSPFILSGVPFSSKRARTKIFPFFSHYFFSPTGFFVSRNFHLFIELTTDLVKKICRNI